MNITRRTLAALLSSSALAACAGQTAAQIGQTVTTDVALIATGVENFVSLSPSMPAGALAKVTTAAQDIQQLVTKLSASMTATQAQPIVQQIAADVTAVAQASAGLVPAGSQAANILADVQLLVPLVLLAVQISAPAAAAPGASDAARTRLAALPKK